MKRNKKKIKKPTKQPKIRLKSKSSKVTRISRNFRSKNNWIANMERIGLHN